MRFPFSQPTDHQLAQRINDSLSTLRPSDTTVIDCASGATNIPNPFPTRNDDKTFKLANQLLNNTAALDDVTFDTANNRYTLFFHF